MRRMKDSGIEWIGEIPEDWVCIKLKNKLTANDGGVWGNEPKSDGNDKIVIRSTEQTIDGKWDIQDPALRDLSGMHYANCRIAVDDLLLTKSSGSSLHIGKTTIADKYFADHECYYSNFIQRLRVKGNARYIWYLLNSPIAREQFVYLQNSTSGIGNVNSDNINNIYVPFPSALEQQRIVGFLDKECAEIDGLIADIQTEIDTLEQYKRSVITEAVTKGLNPDVEIGNGGIEWLGEYPAHWQHYRGKYIFAQRNEKGNCIELQLLSPTQSYGVIPQSKYEELSGMGAVKLNEGINLALLKTIHKGDFCISLRSFQGGFEYSFYEGVVSPAYQVFYPTKAICDGYYKYLFKERSFINVMNSYTLSLRDGKNIAFKDFGNTEIPYPPIEEQEQIAKFLDEKCEGIESCIKEKQAQIDTLESYKKSIIFEYVTGKKEVQ